MTPYFSIDIQRLYDSTNRLVSHKQIDHDKMSFTSEAQFAAEELKVFLEAESLNEIKKNWTNFIWC